MGSNSEKMPLSDEVQEAFAFFDEQDQKYLEWAVFERMVQSLGQTPTRTFLKELFDKTCPDGKAVETAFKVFDNRGNGFINDEQFQTMLKGVGDNLSPDEYDAALKKAKELSGPNCEDTDGKPAINWRAFLDWMMPPQ